MPPGLFLPAVQIARFGAWSVLAPHETAPWRGRTVTGHIDGEQTDTQPIDALAASQSGSIIQTFGFAHWYERIHVIPRAIDLGNITSQQTRPILAWNAYLSPRTLATVTGTNTEGVSLISPAEPPLSYAPLQERTYTLQVSTDGPSELNASYEFAFGAEALTVTITGSRVIAWAYRPDWSQPIVERLEWATDILRAYDGTEQRVRLRQYPRRVFEFAFAAEASQRRGLETALYGWGARNWALPVWPDGVPITTPALSGASSVVADTEHRDFRVGGLLMLLADDGTNEVHEIASISSGTITIQGALARNWPTGSGQIFPVRLARQPAAQGFARFTHDFAYGRARFEAVDDNDWPAAEAETTYLGQPVMTAPPNWIQDPALDYQRKLQEVDFGAARSRTDESGIPDILQTHRWMLSTKAEIAQHRSWLYARAGRLSAVWLPTWADDLIVAATVSAAATTIDINAIGYARQINAAIHRRDLRIETADGSVHYRRITGAEILDDTTERISINAPLGALYQPEDFRKVSFMALCRLESDAAEIAYFIGDTAESATTLRAARHDI